MARTQKLRCAVIGAGAFAEACHIPGLQSHPDATVLALCGRRYDHTREVANRFNIPYVHTDYNELCSRADIDAVTIATPNAFHAEPAIVALRHGKHVLCEKPLALSVTEAAKMLDVAVSSGKIHQVAFTFRYSYAVQELRRRLQSGDIGEPHYLRIQYDSWTGLMPDWKAGWREQQRVAGGGMLYDLGAHLFDVARFILGPLEIVTGFVQNFPRFRGHCLTGDQVCVETDDIAAAWFRHATGVRGQWFVSRATPPYTENGWLEVTGIDGALKASLSRGKVDRLRVSRPAHPDWQDLPLPSEASDDMPHCLTIMMQSFVEACLGEQSKRVCDASFVDGLATQEAIEAVVKANERMSWIPLKHAT